MLQTSYKSRNSKPLSKRFWEKVDKQSKKACWNWLGAKARKERGVLWVDGHNMSAPRVCWELHFGEIPKGLLVCHTCNNPSCINPSHLYLATHKQNLRDASRDGLLTKAKDGEDNPKSRLTEDQVLTIRRRYVKGSRRGSNSSFALAKEFGVNQSWIQEIVARRAWTHI